MGQKKQVGIIGYPILHSVSPAMHNAAFKHLELDWEYVAFEVKPGELKDKLKELRDEGFAGWNVTIPLKEAVIPLLDDVTKLPRTIGAVNTIKNENGKLIGYNTDAEGFIESLRVDAGFEPKGKSAVLLGAGGAAKAAAIMLAESGASSITISDIDTDKALKLSEYVASLFEVPMKMVAPESSSLKNALAKADLVVNATPIGMHPKENDSPMDSGAELGAQSTVFDLVYNPPETELMKLARSKGAKAINGLGMLVRQGALSFTIWTEKKAPVDVMWNAAELALKTRI